MFSTVLPVTCTTIANGRSIKDALVSARFTEHSLVSSHARVVSTSSSHVLSPDGIYVISTWHKMICISAHRLTNDRKSC